MLKKTFAATLWLLTAAFANAAATISGVGAVLHPLNEHDSDAAKNLTTSANGPRLIPAGGGIWFLESNADRIAYFKSDVITEWPIRSHTYPQPFNSIGASPADFELDPDGITIWFIENGNSGIDANESVFAKLDTVTNQMTEWIMPVSKPAGFFREPDGATVWLAMSQGSLVSLNLQTLAVNSFRGPDSLAYSGLIVGSDGLFYMTDFGNNRIVRYDPASFTETAWQAFDPNTTRELATQPTFGPDGRLYYAEAVGGGAFGQFDFATGVLTRFAAGYLVVPTHFFLQGNFIYGEETASLSGDGSVVLVDMTQAAAPTLTLTPKTSTFVELPLSAARVQTFTLTPNTFQSSDKLPDSSVVAAVAATGVSRFTLPHGTNFPSTTSYSIAPIGSTVVCGVNGALAEFTLLPAAAPQDLIVPLAFNRTSGAIQTDVLGFNSQTSTTNLGAFFYSSPLPPPPSGIFAIAAKNTVLFANALGSSLVGAGDATGSLDFTVDPNDMGHYKIITRSYRVLPSGGGTYGFALPAHGTIVGMTTGSTKALLLGVRDEETSVFGIYSPNGASGSATLHGPDGSIRGTYSFLLPSNNRQEFNPAFTAFGVAAETGDYITFNISSGYVFPYSNLYQPATQDVAVGLPVSAYSDFVFPLVGSGPGADNTNYASDVLLANPDPQNPVTVVATLYLLDSSQPVQTLTVTLPAGGTSDLTFDPSSPGIGSLLVKSSGPVYSGLRVANRTAAGDYAGFAAPVSESLAASFLLPGDSRLRHNLVFFNRGAAGTVSVAAFDGKGNATTTLSLPVGDHRPLVVTDIDAAVGLASSPGRIEVSGSAGTLIYPWLTTLDRITGDPDIQPPFRY